ncbi:MAG: hypothetical protein HYY93_00665 [Planctomycetes bacterium]|nr:hypothetical protein [Planctomycetota bacterium]
MKPQAFAPFLCAALILVAGASRLLADTVVLKNGSVFKGEIEEETDEKIVLKVQEGKMTFRKSQIEQIMRDGKMPPPESTPPPSDPSSAPPENAEPPPTPATPPSGGGGSTDLDSIPQTPRITLAFQDKPLSLVLEEFTRQARHQTQWGFLHQDSPNVSVSIQNAALWEALFSICDSVPCGFEVTNVSGVSDVLQLDDNNPRVLARQVRGPAALVSYGVVTYRDYDQEKQQWGDRTGLRLDLLPDPYGGVTVKEPRLDPSFQVSIDGGAPRTIKAEKEVQAPLESRAWYFPSGDSLAGNRADISVTLPLWAASATGEVQASWTKGEVATSGDVQLTVDDAVTKKEKRRDPRDLKTEMEEESWSATCTLIHSGGLLMKRLGEERRNATPEEQKRMQGMPEAAVLHRSRAWVIGENGERKDASIESPSGLTMSSPWTGYRFLVVYRTPVSGFKPQSVVVEWLGAFRSIEVDFEVKGIPLQPVEKK